MSEAKNIWRDAEQHFSDIDCGRDSAMLFVETIREDEDFKEFLKQELTGKTVIDIGCSGIPPIYGLKIKEAGANYIGIDPYAIPHPNWHEPGLEFQIGNPLELIESLEEEPIFMVCNLDIAVLYIDSFKMPESVKRYIDYLNNLIFSKTPSGRICIIQNYLGLAGLLELGFEIERSYGISNQYIILRKP